MLGKNPVVIYSDTRIRSYGGLFNPGFDQVHRPQNRASKFFGRLPRVVRCISRLGFLERERGKGWRQFIKCFDELGLRAYIEVENNLREHIWCRVRCLE
jgi:hypothetical protein